MIENDKKYFSFYSWIKVKLHNPIKNEVSCGLSMTDYPETHRKPPETGRRGFQIFLLIKKLTNKTFLKKNGNLPEIVRGGFWRFPDNPSLTDHTVCT